MPCCSLCFQSISVCHLNNHQIPSSACLCNSIFVYREKGKGKNKLIDYSSLCFATFMLQSFPCACSSNAYPQRPLGTDCFAIIFANKWVNYGKVSLAKTFGFPSTQLIYVALHYWQNSIFCSHHRDLEIDHSKTGHTASKMVKNRQESTSKSML